MNDYTYQDMMRMQSEAKRRVIEMQKRSKDVADNFNTKRTVTDIPEDREELPRIPRAISYPAELPTQPRHNEHRKKALAVPVTEIKNMLASAFGNLTGDDYERMFILALCLLLSKEGTDESLIIALMYLLT